MTTMLQEPLLAYNLFLTAIGGTILGFLIKSWFKGLEKRAEDRYADLEQKAEDRYNKYHLELVEGLNSKASKESCGLKHELVDSITKDMRCDIKEIKVSIQEIFRISREHLTFHARMNGGGE
jgi:hypothetical protein